MNQDMNQGRLWIRLIRRHKVISSTMVPCTREDPLEALRQALPSMDLSQPMWLSRHQADWDEYALTRFKAEHFLEEVPFDSMEISYIYGEEEGKPQRKKHILEDV